MDLTQQKLSKAEWLNVEVMVPPSEKEILNIIIDGYENVNIRRNNIYLLKHLHQTKIKVKVKEGNYAIFTL